MSRAEQRPEDETTITGFEWVGDQEDDPTHPQDTRPAVAWRPRDERRCLNCGTIVDEVTRKVVGRGPNNEINGCPECVDANWRLGDAGGEIDGR